MLFACRPLCCALPNMVFGAVQFFAFVLILIKLEKIYPEKMSKELEVVHSSRGRRFLLVVETTGRAEDYRKFEQLRNLIWDDPEDGLPGPVIWPARIIFTKAAVCISVSIVRMSKEALKRIGIISLRSLMAMWASRIKTSPTVNPGT